MCNFHVFGKKAKNKMFDYNKYVVSWVSQLSASMETEQENLILSTVKHTEMSENKNLGTCVCVTQCLCVLHTYNIKHHLPGPWGRSCPTTLLASPPLVHFFSFFISHPFLLHCYCRRVILHSSQTYIAHSVQSYNKILKKSSQPTDKKTEHCFLFLSLSCTHTHTHKWG